MRSCEATSLCRVIYPCWLQSSFWSTNALQQGGDKVWEICNDRGRQWISVKKTYVNAVTTTFNQDGMQWLADNLGQVLATFITAFSNLTTDYQHIYCLIHTEHVWTAREVWRTSLTTKGWRTEFSYVRFSHNCISKWNE